MLIKKYPASEFVKNAMEIKGLTSYQLSRYAKISNKTLSLLLNNRTPFTIKMDHKMARILGYDIGILSAIEAKYLEYSEQLNKQEMAKEFDYITNINNTNSNYNCFLHDKWNFRKHNVNEEKLYAFLDKCEKKILNIQSKRFDKYLLKNFVLTSLYKLILNVDDSNLDKLNKILELLFEYGVTVLISNDSINVRGLSRENGNAYFIIINQNLNKYIDKFVFTLMHEIFHLYVNDYLAECNNLKDNDYIENFVDKLASNYLLNDNYEILKDLNLENSNMIEEIADNFSINKLLLEGFLNYKNKNFQGIGKEINFGKLKNFS